MKPETKSADTTSTTGHEMAGSFPASSSPAATHCSHLALSTAIGLCHLASSAFDFDSGFALLLCCLSCLVYSLSLAASCIAARTTGCSWWSCSTITCFFYSSSVIGIAVVAFGTVAIVKTGRQSQGGCYWSTSYAVRGYTCCCSAGASAIA